MMSARAGELVFTRGRRRARTSHVHPIATLQIVCASTITQLVGRERFELAPGVAIFKPAGTRYSERAEATVEDLVVEIPERLALAHVVADRTARAWALNLAREVQTRRPGWARIAEGLTLEGLGHLERLHWLARRRPKWLDDAVKLARHSHPLAAIASRLGKHPSHIAREFRLHEGVSVGEYARRRRLELAADRLRTTEQSLAEVAVAFGFCDQSHFTNAFHRLYDVTPAAYRRAARSA